MKEKSAVTTIYVYLLSEGTHVWRPVAATHLEGSTYQISRTISLSFSGRQALDGKATHAPSFPKQDIVRSGPAPQGLCQLKRHIHKP